MLKKVKRLFPQTGKVEREGKENEGLSRKDVEREGRSETGRGPRDP